MVPMLSSVHRRAMVLHDYDKCEYLNYVYLPVYLDRDTKHRHVERTAWVDYLKCLKDCNCVLKLRAESFSGPGVPFSALDIRRSPGVFR